MTDKKTLTEQLTEQISALLIKALETQNLEQGGKLNPAQLVLPKSVDELPDLAKEEFVAVYKSTDGSEEDKLAVAWKAVKRKWKKVEPEDSEDEESADHEKGETDDEEKAEDEKGKDKKKKFPFWMKKDLLGPILGDVDQLRRQLITDGYPEAADEVALASQAEGDYPLVLDSLPHGYRETISERYFRARKEESSNEAFELEVAFKALLDERKVTYGVVYPADEVDLQKEWATETVIEDAAHNFMANYRQHDMFHNEHAGAGVPVESFIAPCDISEFHGKHLAPDQIIKKGSWVMATKWTDETWSLVKGGKIKGYSIGGFKRVRR